MANLEKTVAIIFEGTDRVSKVIGSIEKSLNTMSSGLGNITDPFAQWQEGILKIDAAFGALAIGGMALAINAAGQFNDQFKEITTLLAGETDANLSTFRNDIKAYAADSKKSIADINAATYQAISLGLDYQDSLKGLATAEKLSIGGKAELVASTELLIGTMNAYGDGIDQASRYSDVFFTIVKDGKTTIPELAQYISQVTSLAASGQVPIETLGAAIAALTAAGVPTSQAMTNIKAAIQGIIKPSEEARKVAAALGIDFSGQALAAKGLDGILREVYKTTGGNVDQMTRLFSSTEALQAALVLGADKSGKFAKALRDMGDSAGATDDAYKKMADSFNLVNQNLINNYQLTIAEFGDRLLADYGDIAASVVAVFQSISQAVRDGSFDDVFDILHGLSEETVQTFKDLAVNLPEALSRVDFGPFAESIRSIADEIRDLFDAFFGDLDLSTLEGLAAAIQKIVDSGTSLNEVTSGIIEGWQTWAQWLGELIDWLTNLDSSTVKTIGNMLTLGAQLSVVAGLAGGLGLALSSVSSLMKLIAGTSTATLVKSLFSAEGAFTALKLSINGVTGVAGQAGLLGLAYAVGYALGPIVDKYIPQIRQAAEATYEWLDALTDFTGGQETARRSTEAMDRLIVNLAQNAKKYKYDLVDVRSELQGLGYDIEGLPDSKIIYMAAEADILSFDDVKKIIHSKVSDETVTISTAIDQPSVDKTVHNLEVIEETVNDLSTYTVKVNDDGSLENLKGRLEKLPTKLSIETELDLKTFEAKTDLLKSYITSESQVIQTQLEWEAKLDIAEVEAQAKEIESIMATLQEAFQSSGNILTTSLDAFGDMTSSNYLWISMKEFIEREFDIREETLAMTKEVTDAELAYLAARTKALERGDAQIQINGAGLQPQLEAFMFEILSSLQLKANAEGANLLVGI